MQTFRGCRRITQNEVKTDPFGTHRFPESAMSFLEDQRCSKGDDQQWPENIPDVAANHTEVLQQKQDSERKYKESKKHRYSPSLTERIKANV
jgi:hypothetical protein